MTEDISPNTEEFDMVGSFGPDERLDAVTCHTVNCDRLPVTRGLCDAHYASRRGDARD